jgi:hypothetical protein
VKAAVLAFGILVSACPEIALGQGVTSAGVHGKVSTSERGTSVRLTIRHDSTGHSIDVAVSHGRYLVQNLEPGGPYSVTARAVGFRPVRRDNFFLRLGELQRLDFELLPLVTALDTITVVASDHSMHRGAHADGGTGMSIPAEQLERLPTLNRDLYDFVRLVPQISTKISLVNPGLSAGGTGFRFNNFLINGTSDRTLSGNVSTAFAGSKSIPLDAVKEYQVLLAPYDVRYGDFAGALVNAVTRAGTNDLRGSMFVFGRTDGLARNGSGAPVSPYEKVQYGFSLGGPVIRDRVHFFIAPELQHFTSPAPGPYAGQPADADRPVPVNAVDLDRFDSIMRSYGLTAGSAGPVENTSPLRNLYARLDILFPSLKSRGVISYNYGGSSDVAFSRDARDEFPLSTYVVKRKSRFRTASARLHTTLGPAGGGDNELLVSFRSDGLDAIAPVSQPIIRVAVPSVSGGSINLTSGTNETAQGGPFRSSSVAVRNNLNLPLGPSHVVTTGAELERFRIRRGVTPLSYGAWSFRSLDDLAIGAADRYDVRIGFGNPDTPITGSQYAAYAGDRWQARDNLAITAGLRADVLAIDGRAPYNAAIDSIFGRSTDDLPPARVEISPRLGFRWSSGHEQQHQIRGGVGIFTTRYPLAWAHTALTAYGVGGTLPCAASGPSRGLPPLFVSDYRNPPTACLGGGTITEQFAGDVNLLSQDLRMMRVLRTSVAHDRALSRDLVLTGEALLSRSLSDFIVMNLNLREPVTTDSRGRVMYGTLSSTGAATPSSRSLFTEVIELRNTSRNHSYSLSTRLERRASTGVNGFASYTWSRTRDVQTPTRVNARGTTLWASARVTSGRHDASVADVSSNDIPHRVILAGTYRQPWRLGRTDVSFYYVGESGRPFTYVAFGTARRGDLNADGGIGNDPIYIPLDARDTTEIRFSGISDSLGADASPEAQAIRVGRQRAAFESLVARSPCMREQRGKILDRNSCREPWTNTTIASLRHAIPMGRRSMEMQLDVFNVLNLVNSGWGRRREAAPALLEHTGQTSGQAQASMPVFRFNVANPDWTTLPGESSFQLQLALRYRL